ncbi:SURF1 family protein [Sanguibacter sp. HDW7]|uniref:SURF1 family protein n=1 Tax=Sanguibacter sp. HDW7 TaxID=2714931 RepID=UPI0014099ECC|nr:SURF1 family protein [Sanguibacter sp. HDW7]QIK82798.1 SURF1 family protein [Sanguibacter sp. HDW7]
MHEPAADAPVETVEPSADDVPTPAAGRPSVADVVRAAFVPRVLVMFAVMVAAVVVCANLGIWQLSRAYERGAQAEQHRLDEIAQAGPRSLVDVLAPQTTFPGAAVGASVAVTGTFEGDQLLVSGRAVDGRTGYLVLAPLRVSDDGSGGASWADLSGAPVLPVVRGWVATPADAPAAPTGTVDVSGYLQSSEAVGDGAIVDGVTDSISSGQLANRWGGPIYSGYLVVSATAPADAPALTLLPRPTVQGGEGVNMQNLFYALQWWIFGLFAVGLWVQMVRDEARAGADPDAFTGWEQFQQS